MVSQVISKTTFSRSDSTTSRAVMVAPAAVITVVASATGWAEGEKPERGWWLTIWRIYIAAVSAIPARNLFLDRRAAELLDRRLYDSSPLVLSCSLNHEILVSRISRPKTRGLPVWPSLSAGRRCRGTSFLRNSPRRKPAFCPNDVFSQLPQAQGGRNRQGIWWETISPLVLVALHSRSFFLWCGFFKR